MKNNKKGFTLVELLAVIVILAVVILIAVTAVIPRMRNAKKSAFKDEALAFVKAAEEAYVSTQMESSTGTGTTCFTVATLTDANNGYIELKGGKSYAGKIVLNSTGVVTGVYLEDSTNSYVITNASYNSNKTLTVLASGDTGYVALTSAQKAC